MPAAFGQNTQGPEISEILGNPGKSKKKSRTSKISKEIARKFDEKFLENRRTSKDFQDFLGFPRISKISGPECFAQTVSGPPAVAKKTSALRTCQTMLNMSSFSIYGTNQYFGNFQNSIFLQNSLMS